MKRIQEKVKDLIEVRAYQNLQNFLADPIKTLTSYHFTDMTADMMAKWLDAAAAVQKETGRAMALAGYRGVGKSHFLATLGAILANPELRSAVTEPHVAAAAQQLKRRRHPVAYIKRGTRDTLLEELKDAIALTFGMDVEMLSNDLNYLLKTAAENDTELPFVLIFDTAFEREARVARDDGVLLGEIAEIAAKLNIFTAVALDDDIAGADGVNASISALFGIDYLDQEHLYRIVDTHIFPKHRQSRALLHEIYEYFRQVLPHFRWSEPRFTSLYPMHPIILEIAPFVRLYAPEFALLGFASVAGAKIMGRPASSLITLDEVFDRVENSLRKVKDLEETFAAFDKIGSEVIGQIPVMQRLHAKLILKALLLLSLDGEGVNAGEIGAAMLVYDENNPHKSADEIEQILDSFSAALPNNITRTADEGREVRYYLKTENKETFNNALSETAAKMPPDVVEKIMRRMMRERFSDWNMPDDANWADSQITWRGGHRRGRISWSWDERETLPAMGEFLDWELVIVNTGHEVSKENVSDEVPKVFWKPAPLRKEETDAILRFYALLTDEDLRAEYSEQIRAAGHAHTLTVEKIFTRTFFNDAKLVIDGFDIEFSDEAKAELNLSGVFSVMLEPLFEGRFANHPYFAAPLGMSEVSLLVNDLFASANSNVGETQRLAETFALPLGLVTLYKNTYIIETEAKLKQIPLAQKVLELVNEKPSETVSLKTINFHLKKEPFGLVREAQHLILTALVAQRQIEFVTTKGDRISRRSLDLQIIWDDIEGVAKPAGKVYSSQRLTDWARILTGANTFKTIDVPEDEDAIIHALNGWLTEWKKSGVIERFSELPDDILNVNIWAVSVQAEKTFGTVAETVKSILENFIPLEEGLHRIADTFSDSEDEFFNTTRNLIVLDDFINGEKLREKIWSYLAICENTDDYEIESLREHILDLLEENYHQPNEALNSRLENLWGKFLTKYSEHFASNHDFVMKSHHLQEKFDEIMRSDAWWEFESLSKYEIFRPTFWQEAQENCRQFKELDCHFNVREMLDKHPFCACSFNLSQIGEWENLPETLQKNIEQGRTSYRRTLQMLNEDLTPMLNEISKSDDEFSVPANNLILRLKENGGSGDYSDQELIVLQKTLSQFKK